MRERSNAHGVGSGRGDEVPRPLPWSFVFGDRASAQNWQMVVNVVPEAADRAWLAITSDPRRTDNRQHQLKGSHATGTYRGRSLPKWQYEITGAGRLWYLVDVEARTLVLIHVSLGHPGATDRGKRRR